SYPLAIQSFVSLSEFAPPSKSCTPQLPGTALPPHRSGDAFVYGIRYVGDGAVFPAATAASQLLRCDSSEHSPRGRRPVTPSGLPQPAVVLAVIVRPVVPKIRAKFHSTSWVAVTVT